MNSIFNKDFWKEILESVNSNGFRTLITAFGVFWGIFILVLLLSASNGFQNGIKRQFSGMSTNTVFIWAQTITKAYKGKPKNRNYSFNVGDGEAIRENIKGLKTISPRNRLGGWGGSSIISHDMNTGSYTVEADYPEILTQRSLRIKEGRFINHSDIKDKRKIVVLGWAIINELFEKGEQVIGSYIKIQGVSFKVVGIYEDVSINGRKNIDEQKKIHVPFTTFSQIFNQGDKVRFFVITGIDDVPITDVKEDIMALIRKRHDIHPEDDRAVGNWDFNKFLQKFTQLFIALKAVSYFVGVMILGSGVIGISNIMLIVIKERTKEIGVRRALGATPSIIRKQVLLESLFLTLFAGMAGVSFAAFVTFIVNLILDSKFPEGDAMLYNPSIDLPTVGVSLLILIVCGLAAGFIPAQTAIKIKPIEALRTD